MADKTIGELTPASNVGPTDLFVLEQNSTAKSLTGQTLENWLLSLADGHGGIQSIAKTSESGLVDTYTITYADATTSTFTVTNGKSISSIVTYYAVSSNGTTPPTNWSTNRQNMDLTNRYLWSHQAITFNDGTLMNTTSSVIGVYGDKGETGETGNGIENLTQTGRVSGQYTVYTFTMTNGATKTFLSYDGAGIADIAKTSTDGLEDTYTVTLTDGSTSTFTVTNAKSIVNVAWTSNSGGGTQGDAGTTDIYTITYNDGDTSTFSVYNGANGTGAVSSVDGIAAVGQNVPLLTIGSGPPTTTTQGSIKSRYFDATNSILYFCTSIDTSTNPTTYTWKGSGVTVDASLSSMSTNPVQNRAIYNKFGTLETSIASKFPYSGGTLNGDIVMANHKITNLGAPTANGDATSKAYVDGVGIPTGGVVSQIMVKQSATDRDLSWQYPEYNRRNLLDNWYFKNPVNQRGQTQYSTAGAFVFDRWKLMSGTAELTSNGLVLNGTIQQTIEEDIDQQYTASILTASGVSSASFNPSTKVFSFTSDGSTAIKAAKLELGSYQTLAHLEGTDWVTNEIPDYASQLAKCQRYLQIIKNSGASMPVATGYASSAGTDIRVFLPLSVPMAYSWPSITLDGTALVYPPSSSYVIVTSVASGCYSYLNAVAFAATTASSVPQGGGLALRLNSGSKLIVAYEI